MLPVFTSPRGLMNASFASRVLALKLRKASAIDSLFDLLNTLPDVRVEGSDGVPLAAIVGVVVGALKRPVQSFGGALADGDVGIFSPSSDKPGFSASLVGVDRIGSFANGCVSADSIAAFSETTVLEGARDIALGTTGRTGTAGICFRDCLAWLGVTGR